MWPRARRKIFCVGHNKTGTTSIGQALQNLGFKLGDQAAAELFIDDWSVRRFDRIVKYCQSADAFQDVPFSLGYTYQALDYAFPRAKFILTIRDSADEWYASLTRFHTKIVGKGRLPTAQDLREFDYRYVGYSWHAKQIIYGVKEDNPYDKDLLVSFYEKHNADVLEYFRHRKKDLLVLNLSQPNTMERLCEFLGIEFANQKMPHLLSSQ